MTEQDIINAINTIADNFEKGITTEPTIVNDDLRKALTRITTAAHKQGYEQGEKHGKDTMTFEEKQRIKNLVNDALRNEYQERYASMEREYYRMKNDIEEIEERATRAEEKQRKATEILREAINNMQCAILDADEKLN